MKCLKREQKCGEVVLKAFLNEDIASAEEFQNAYRYFKDRTDACIDSIVGDIESSSIGMDYNQMGNFINRILDKTDFEAETEEEKMLSKMAKLLVACSK